jgi:hypothetical protein
MISTQKTKPMTTAMEPPRCKLFINGKTTEKVMEMAYLGIELTSNKNLDQEVAAQTVKAKSMAG